VWLYPLADTGRRKNTSRICLIDVPVSKTYAAFTKPVDPIVGEYIERWEQVRSAQSLQEDPKTGENVHFLFMHRGKRVHGSYQQFTRSPAVQKRAYLNRMPEAGSPAIVQSDHRQPALQCPRTA
jgi:hypothetical protein